MIFNFTNKYKFVTRLEANQENIEVVDKTKLLGVFISSDLKWEENTNSLVKRAYGRMQLLRKVASFTTKREDLLHIYKIFVRPILEQSCTVWSSSLTKDCIAALERVQKGAFKIILGDKYKNYEESLKQLHETDLLTRRNMLSLKFAKKCTRNPKMKHLFPLNKQRSVMKLRKQEKFKINHIHTERFKRSAIPQMKILLNKYHIKEKRNS